MSSGGGSTTTQSTQLPSWLEDAAKSNLARAGYVSQIGYVPQYGLDVAGFTPMQQSAMQNTANAASAFGLAAPTDAMAGMPAQQTNNLGFSGYSSGALFDDYLSNLAAQRPAQYDAINAQFIDPYSGQAGVAFTPVGSISNTGQSDVVNSMVNYNGGSDFTGSGADAVNFSQSLQNLADAPAWLSLLPIFGTAKTLATSYVNDQAKNTANNYANTNRGFSDDGNTYTSSWGNTYNTSGFSPQTMAGLAAVANDPFSAASGQAHSYGDFAD
jgi:hypothetical protein